MQLEGFRLHLCGQLIDYKTNDIVVLSFMVFTFLSQSSHLVFTEICEEGRRESRILDSGKGTDFPVDSQQLRWQELEVSVLSCTTVSIAELETSLLLSIFQYNPAYQGDEQNGFGKAWSLNC